MPKGLVVPFSLDENQSFLAFIFLMLFDFIFFEFLITKDTLFSVWAVHVMFFMVLSFVKLVAILALQKQILTLLIMIFDFFSIRKLIITKRAANLKIRTLIYMIFKILELFVFNDFLLQLAVNFLTSDIKLVPLPQK